MSIFSYTQIIKGDSLFIPYEHRAIFGWHSNLNLYVSSLHQSDDKTKSSNEIVLSPINPRDRLDLWRIQLSFIDRKKLLADLTCLLCNLNIDIVSSKVTNSDQGKYLHVDMQLDNQLYKNRFDKETASRKKNKIIYLDELKNLILAKFIEDIVFVSSTVAIPVAKIKRNLPLYRSYELLDQHGRNMLINGFITIPSIIIDDIKKRFERRFPKLVEQKGKNSYPRASIVADYESNIARAFIYFKDTHILHVRVNCKNRVGSISKICEVFDDTDFNIDQMNNRVIDDGSSCLSDFLLTFNHKKDNFKLTDIELRKILRQAFIRANKENKDFKLKISFPKIKEFNHEQKL